MYSSLYSRRTVLPEGQWGDALPERQQEPHWAVQVKAFHSRRPRFAMPPDWDDLEHLYRLVMETGPATVLEYGSGCSTVAMAMALMELGDQRVLWSLESDPLWYEINYLAIPFHGLARLVFSPVADDGHDALRYTLHPVVWPDLVYVDGPALLPGREYIMDVLGLGPPWPQTIIVDGRMKQAEKIASDLGRVYDGVYDQRSFRSVFTKKPGAEQESR